MTGSNETTKAQGQGNEGDKTSNAKDQKIKTDIDSVMQVTRYILKNDWKDLEEYIMSKTSNTLTDKITGGLSIFDLIVNSDAPPMFLDKLVSKVHQNFLQEWVSNEGNACMVHAATGGKSKLIEILMRYNANLPNVRDKSKLLPIHKAAQLGQRDTVRYLLSKTTEHLDGHDWSTLLKDLINCNLFGIPAQEEYGPHPHLHSENADGDLEKQLSETSPFAFGSLHKKLKTVLWNSLTRIAPSIKSIRNTKLAHKQTLEILRIICVGAVDIATAAKETENVLKKPMFTAAKFGIYEIVMEIIISYFPWSLSFSNEDGDDIFHAAVKHRQENVFNIIFNMPKAQTFFVADIDVKGVNILHSAARSVPSSEVSGAALQMQRELQWFKAVENYVHPTLQDQLNDEDKTPRELFTEEHKGLVKEGEKWMKDTAQSCSLVDRSQSETANDHA
ncbi:ANK REP REGION domain-containing protein [Citrus sinensis]|nr:ANK REP REGION domain-containing protein [Citrus sinensis]